MTEMTERQRAIGRNATSPVQIPAKGWGAILMRVAGRIMPSQIGLIAAGIAFYTLLAIFPSIAAMMALAGLFTDPVNVVAQLQSVTALLPDEAALIVLNQAQLVAGASDEGLSLTLFLGVGFAIYLATRATTGLIHGLNIAYGETEARGFIHFWIVVILLTAALLFGGLMLVLLLVGLPAALAVFPVDFETERVLNGVRWAFVAVVFIAGIDGLYRWGPSRTSARWRWLTPGAAVAGLLWFLGSLGFAAYVANFANYNQTFGSLGGVVILLTWIWLSSFIILLGALLDAETEAQTARDSTVGPEKPIGERGAVKADELGQGYSGISGDEHASDIMRIVDRFELAGRGTVVLTDHRTELPQGRPLRAVIGPGGEDARDYTASKEWLLHQKGVQEDEAFLLRGAKKSDIDVGASLQVYLKQE